MMFECSARPCACAVLCMRFRGKVKSIGKVLFDDVMIIFSIRPFCDTFEGNSIGHILATCVFVCVCARYAIALVHPLFSV